MSAVDVARSYARRGWSPIPIPYGTKRPVLEGWQQLRLREDTVDRYFNGAAQNIGVILGRASGGLVDVDLDCPEALRVASEMLPPTSTVFGRASKAGAHRLYLAGRLDPETGEVTAQRCPTTQFKDPTDNGMLVELRG